MKTAYIYWVVLIAAVWWVVLGYGLQDRELAIVPAVGALVIHAMIRLHIDCERAAREREGESSRRLEK